MATSLTVAVYVSNRRRVVWVSVIASLDLWVAWVPCLSGSAVVAVSVIHMAVSGMEGDPHCRTWCPGTTPHPGRMHSV